MVRKIQIEELDSNVIAINDGQYNVCLVEAINTLDYHLAKTAISNFTEMLNRYLRIKRNE